jgi:deoxyribonuclease-4
LILETPQQIAEVAEDDATPDPWDVTSVGLLRTLATDTV